MTELRRGFKTEANDIARDIRQELGLRLADPLDPWALAKLLAIPVVPLGALAGDAPLATQLFLHEDRGSFSAVTVFHGYGRVIVHNDAHSLGRQASNLAHELAHALLLHQSSPAIDDRGCRYWDAELEAEADWLAGALLISEEAALQIARSGMSMRDAAKRYGVSEPMVQFRINVTGARKRVAWGRKPLRPRRRPGD